MLGVMSIFEDTNPRALKDLLAEINSKETVLPDFQRDFVWDPAATQELIVSIANNYPAGSILRVRDSYRVFACREIEGAPKLNAHQHTFLVLDGQQRLTSLYQAFYGVGDHRYYLSLSKLLEGMDFEEAIFHERSASKRAKELEHFSVQAEQLVLPLAVLKGGAGGFLQWILKVTNPMVPDQRATMLDALTSIDEMWIKAIDDYHFPVITLAARTTPDALCTIFETLNRTGVKLTVFELLTARFWSQGVNLRQLWDDAVTRYPVISDFQIDPYYVLQAVAIAGRATPSCKRKDVLNLDKQLIVDWWSRAIDGMAVGLQILIDDCGVILPKWMPYQTMLIPLAAVLADVGPLKTAKAGANREKIKQWFWCSVFGQSYESAANSQSAHDFMALKNWLTAGTSPSTVAEFQFDPNILREVTPRQRAVYRGIICLVLSNGARDFHTCAPITRQLVADEGIDDHHVFPDHYLEAVKGVGSSKLRDCILNRTLIDRTTNQMIGARAPSDYLSEMRNTNAFPFEEILSSHRLPVGPQAPYWDDDYEAFLLFRQALIWRDIIRVTGMAASPPVIEAQALNAIH